MRPVPPEIAVVSDADFVASLRARGVGVKPLRVYVAGASREMNRCVAVIAAVRAAGHVITHDWTEPMRAAGKPDTDFEDDELRPFLTADLDGVESADALLLLLPEFGSASSGMSTELGYAICLSRSAKRLRIVASRGYTPADPTRCERCGWPLHARVEDGCTADNCSQRPLPPLPAPRGRANGWARCFGHAMFDTDAEAIAALAAHADALRAREGR